MIGISGGKDSELWLLLYHCYRIWQGPVILIRRVMLPTENRRGLAHILRGILDKLQIIFYTDVINSACGQPRRLGAARATLRNGNFRVCLLANFGEVPLGKQRLVHSPDRPALYGPHQ